MNISEYREELKEVVANMYKNLHQSTQLKQNKVGSCQSKFLVTQVIDDFESSMLSSSIRPRNYTMQKKNSKKSQASFEIEPNNIIFLRSEEDDESSEVDELRISEISMKWKIQSRVNFVYKI